MKKLCLVLAIFASMDTALWAEGRENRKMTACPAYFFAFVVGFGTGRYLFQEYPEGTGFLIAELVGLSIGAYGVQVAPSGSSASIASKTIGLGIFVMSRIWEAIDIFGVVDRAKKAGKIVDIVPVLDVRLTSFELGVSLRY